MTIRRVASMPRLLAAVSLVATALLTTVWTITEPEMSGDFEGWLASLAEAGGRAQLSGLAFVLAQLPFLVGVAGLARWLQPSRLATVGGIFAVLGGFGHAVYGGVMLTHTVMAVDRANASVYAGLLEDLEATPALLPFMVFGLLGTVIGVLLLSIAWWRSRTEPRWVAPLLWAFLVVEFVGTNFSEWAVYLSTLLYLLAFGAMALRVGGGSRIASATTVTARQPEMR
ncbi:MAG TPA: hypothetical protein VFX33_07455 [Actinomycetales bacterium]|nr:hypothetical protein [Actinomycetales bacterium]